MSSINKYVCDLLYRNNCVIVPNFGAFLTQRVSASFSNDKRNFYPPKKLLSFNNQVVTNDGLLANYISKTENISYEAAIQKIADFVKEVNSELKLNQKVSFDELGFFIINSENSLVFHPLHTVNYLTEAFGLSHFSVTEIERTTEKSIVFAEQINTVEDTKVLPLAPENSATRSNIVLKYAAVGVLLLGVSGIGFNTYKKNVDNYNVKQYVKAEETVNQELQSASFVFEVKEILPSLSINISNEIESNDGKNNFHIIAGAFRNKSNATRKLNQLKAKGFNSEYIGENSYGLHQISYGSRYKENDAINFLNKIKRTENQKAWLLVSE